VFVHGVGVGLASFEWKEVCRSFAEDHRVYAVDLLGFGESRRPSPPLSAEEHVRTLAEFVRSTCQGDRPVMIGSGLGAAFALAMTRHHPELADRVIAMIPAGLEALEGRPLPLGMRLIGRIGGLNRFLYRNYLANRSAIRRWLEEAGFYDRTQVSEEVVDLLHRYAQQAGAEHAIFHFLRGHLNLSLETLLPEVTVPAHLVWLQGAGADHEGEVLAERLAGYATIDYLEGVGILAAMEAPGKVAEIIRQLMEQSGLRII